MQAQLSQKPADEIPPLAPPLPEIQPTLWEQHGILIVVAIVALLAVIAFALWLLLKPKPQVPVPPEVQARNRLTALAGLPESGEVLSQVSQVLRGYIAAAFELPPGEMNTTEFCAAVRTHPQINPELAAALADFLRSCDDQKFAPPTIPPMPGVTQRALQLVEQAEARRAWLRTASRTTPA